MIMRIGKRLGNRQDGSVMAAVVMVLMVVSVVAVTSIKLAQHSNDASSVDRERVQTVSAAEAGVTDAIQRIETGAGCDGAATAFKRLYDGTKLLGSFRTRVDPEAGTTCGQTPRRVIHSWGYAPTGGTRALRHLEVTVELVPQAGFPFTLFAEGNQGTIYVKNSGTISGDVYSEILDQTKNNITAEDIITTGSVVTKNNAAYAGTLWAGGNVTIGDNGVIGQSIIATGTASGTQGTIALNNNSIVGGDVRAKGAVTQGSGVVVHGSLSQNSSGLPPPPVLTKPTFTWNAANYPPATLHEGTAAAITTLLNTNRNALQGTYHATDTGTVLLPDNVTVTGPLTIVATGKVSMGRSMSVSGGPYQVVVVALSTAADAVDISKSLTIASGLETLIYTLGGVDQKNAVSMTGSIYADFIDAKNTYTVTKAPSLTTSPPVGFVFNFGSAPSFAAIPTLWREIVPGLPPA